MAAHTSSSSASQPRRGGGVKAMESDAQRRSRLLQSCEAHVRERREELVQALRRRSPADLVNRIVAEESARQRDSWRGSAGTALNFGSSSAASSDSQSSADDYAGLSEAERLEFLLYLEQTLLGESARSRAEEDVYDALEREDAAYASEHAEFVGDRAYDDVRGHGSTFLSSLQSAPADPGRGRSPSTSASALAYDLAADADDVDRLVPSSVAQTDVLCPVCKCLRLGMTATSILCKCGFRMETPGGSAAGIEHLEASLATAYSLHREHCATEPTFQIADHFGVRTLVLDCRACHAMAVVM